jgi:hypothetical protein
LLYPSNLFVFPPKIICLSSSVTRIAFKTLHHFGILPILPGVLPPHNLNHPLYNLRFFIIRFFPIAIVPQNQLNKKDGTRPCCSTDGP